MSQDIRNDYIIFNICNFIVRRKIITMINIWWIIQQDANTSYRIFNYNLNCFMISNIIFISYNIKKINKQAQNKAELIWY